MLSSARQGGPPAGAGGELRDQPGGRQPRVLIVDDEAAILRCYLRLLRNLEAQIIAAETAEEALEVMNQGPVDVIVSDFRLPGMDGGQLLQAVHLRWPATVRILITGGLGSGVGAEMIDRSIDKAAVHRFLLKPCDANDFRAAVIEAIGWARSPARPPEACGGAAQAAHRRAFEDAIDPMMVADLDGHLLEVNRAFVDRLGGVERTSLALRPTLVSGWDADWEEVSSALEQTGRWCDEVHDRASDRHALLSIAVVTDADGRPALLVATERELTATRRAEKESLEIQHNLLLALSNLAEFRDPETGAHLKRIRGYSRALALELATAPRFSAVIDALFVESIDLASALHDVGKVGIPDEVLLKPGRLTDKEFAIMKTHSRIGAEILARVAVHGALPCLTMAESIALQHHERFDGTGYPSGLRGDQIHLAARIVALADAYDAITTDRVYRKAMSHAEARRIILEEEGTHFDPEVVQAFLRAEGLFQEIDSANQSIAAESPPVSVEGKRSASQILTTINLILEAQRAKRLRVWG